MMVYDTYFKAHLLLALGDCKGIRKRRPVGYPTLKQQQVSKGKLFTESMRQDQKIQSSTSSYVEGAPSLSLEGFSPTHTPNHKTNRGTYPAFTTLNL